MRSGVAGWGRSSRRSGSAGPLLACAALVALGAAGCSQTAKKGGCATDAACASGLVCDRASGSCVRPPAVAVSISPAAAIVLGTASLALAANVSNATDASVDWSVAEGMAGGVVSPAGVYTAPLAAGVYHVVATSHADPSKSARADITVPAISVSLDPQAATVQGLATVQLTAAVANAVDRAVAWSVSSGGGSISPDGLYSAPDAVGTYVVTATSVADPARSAQAQIAVGPPPVASIAVTPAAPSLIEGATLALSAVAYDALGAPLSPQPSSFAWSSSAPDVAAVDGAGLLTAARAGSATITASAGGVTSAGDVVAVQPPPPTLHIAAALSEVRAGDAAVAIAATVAHSTASVSWTLSGPGQLSAATGAAISYTPPAYTAAQTSAIITATLGATGVSDRATVLVDPAAVATVAVTSGVACLAPAGSAQLAAVAYDAHGTQLFPTFTWDTADHAVAAVDASGKATGLSGGLTTATASAGGVTSPPSTVSVNPPPAGRMAYSAFDAAAGKYRVRLVNLDGTGEIIVADGWDPRLAPDKSALLYRRGGTHPSGIGDSLYLWDLTAASNNEKLLFANNDYMVSHTWTNDSKKVIFDYQCSVLVEGRDGAGTAAFLTAASCYDDAPDTNPVDGRVAFENQQFTNFINIVGADGTGRTAVPNTPGDFRARWSPDGAWLALYRSTSAVPGRVDKIRPDGTGRTILTTFPIDSANHALMSGPFTPDGKWVVVPLSRGSAGATALGIYAVAADGSGCMVPIQAAASASVDLVGSISAP